MSDLAEDLQALLEQTGPQPYQKTCSVAKILGSLTEEQREKLDILLMDGCRVPSGKVAETLRKWGYDVAYNSIQRHRRRHRGTGCQCP